MFHGLLFLFIFFLFDSWCNLTILDIAACFLTYVNLFEFIFFGTPLPKLLYKCWDEKEKMLEANGSACLNLLHHPLRLAFVWLLHCFWLSREALLVSHRWWLFIWCYIRCLLNFCTSDCAFVLFHEWILLYFSSCYWPVRIFRICC